MVTCGKCGMETYIYKKMRIGGKKTIICGACVKSLKEYFEERDESTGKDIRLCSCCKKFKEVGYEDSYEKGRILFCKDCTERYMKK